MEIVITNLSKSYSRRTALKDISLTIPAGIYGLLGRNGAGKTSLMRILAGLSAPSGGGIRMDNISIRETARVREIVGYLSQDFSMYQSMTVFGAMDYLGLLSEIPNPLRRERINALLERVNLKDEAGTRIRALSGGMLRRLGIAQALLHDPRILIVDEPTAGLDPEERIRIRSLLSDFSEGRIVLLSTHIASDVEAICGRVAVLHEGSLLFQGSTEELSGLADGKVYQITAPKEQDQQIREKYICLNISHLRGGMEYRVLSDAPQEEPWEVRQPSLEDGYMYLLRSQEMGWTAGKAEGRQITNIEKAETDGAQVTKIEKAEACGPRIPKIEKARACGAGTCGEQCSDRGGADL